MATIKLDEKQRRIQYNEKNENCCPFKVDLRGMNNKNSNYYNFN